jgi:hypothetical protein
VKPAVVVLFFQFVKIDLIFVTVICAGSATWNKPHDRNERKPMLDIASVKSSNIDITINACKISILYPTNQEIDNKNKSIYFVLCSLTDSKHFFVQFHRFYFILVESHRILLFLQMHLPVTAVMSFEKDGAIGRSTTLRNKRHCTLCFWLLERRKLKPLIKDKCRGDAYGCVYDTQPECAEGLVPSSTLLGALYILPRVSNLSVLSIRHFLRPK